MVTDFKERQETYMKAMLGGIVMVTDPGASPGEDMWRRARCVSLALGMVAKQGPTDARQFQSK